VLSSVGPGRLAVMRFEGADEPPERIDAVYKLYLGHSTTLGFMPKGGFTERAAKGTLLAAITDDGAVVGYIMYDLPRHHIAVRHLCVSGSERRSGLARALVGQVVRRHPQRDGMLLECRNDYPAHEMWPKLDFEPVLEVTGRSQERLPLTRWWRGFSHPTLFSYAPEPEQPMLRVATDTDVFIDLYEDRDNCAESRALLTDWVRETAQLVITKEVVTEIKKHSDPAVRDRNRRHALSFVRADSSTEGWEAAKDGLLEAMGRPELHGHNERDLRQVARAAAAHVDYFVSRDNNLVERYRRIAFELFGLKVTNPGNCVQELWDQLGGPYAPLQIENTTFQIEPAPPGLSDEIISAFLNTRHGEKKSNLQRALAKLRVDPSRSEVRLVRNGDGQLVALFGRASLLNVLEIPILRTAGPASRTIARQVVYLQRTHANAAGSSLLHVTDSAISADITEALIAESFVRTDNGWWAAPVACHDTPAALAARLAGIENAPEQLVLRASVAHLLGNLGPAVVAELERRHAPMKIAGAPLRTYLVPIKPEWAEQLFDTELVSQTLLGRDDDLGISREHVYYCAASPRSISVPARILWYVSAGRIAGGHRLGTSAIRACSRLEEVVQDRPLTLYRRFRHLGVYKQNDVIAATNKGHRVTALRFAETELFRNPVPLADLRELASLYRHTPVLRSLRLLPEGMFDAIYERGDP
jgi:hypothetical protein